MSQTHLMYYIIIIHQHLNLVQISMLPFFNHVYIYVYIHNYTYIYICIYSLSAAGQVGST